ncbi:MAG: hypothetical protein HQL75_07685 [Magnetococcales bacterium]|nr:hypothetical protein [Magnetococcales bacterium]
MISIATGQAIDPAVSGSGLLALDVIFGPEGPVALPGGTCGNVLLTLGEMGHITMPLAHLGHDQPGQMINDEFRRVGAILEGLHHDSSISTPIILQYWHRDPKDGEDHYFSFRSPTTNKRFPAYRTISNTLVEEIAPRLSKIAIFFFDRISHPILRAAKLAKHGGATIIFEPSSIDDPILFQQAMETCHILKFSEKRLGHEMESMLRSTSKPELIIKTKGCHGIEVIMRGRSGCEHVSMPAPVAPRLIDSCGSGDAVTAILIHLLLTQHDRSSRAILDYLAYGQEIAAINCGFLGARGAFLSLGWSSLVSNVTDRRKVPKRMIKRTSPFAGLEKGQSGTLFLS